MKGYQRYFVKKLVWMLVTLCCAIILNFFLPRLMPGDPVQAITSKLTEGFSDSSSIQSVYDQYARQFGTDKPLSEQFFTYVGNLFQGDFGYSFSQYPRPVSDIISSSIGWTLALQFPAIIVGWLIGNVLGVLAAYIRKGFDKVLMPIFLLISTIPAFGMAIIMLVIFSMNLGIAPIGGGYSFDLIPEFSWTFVQSVIAHYQLPFWTLVLLSIGSQAIGMRSMSIYELNADYVKYSRLLGVKDKQIVAYVFRNAMLPQVTGLAMSIGMMVGGALVAETIFSYPGLGSTILSAVTGSDYPLISAATLIITIMVLAANFLLELVYGLIDPRIKAAQID